MRDPAPPRRRTHGGTGAGALALVKPLPPKAVAEGQALQGANARGHNRHQRADGLRFKTMSCAASVSAGTVSSIRNSKEAQKRRLQTQFLFGDTICNLCLFTTSGSPRRSPSAWHGYSTRWLARKFPEDAAILLSSTRDGRSLKNRGYRSKESVDRLAPDFDREARSEGWREFGL